MLAGLAVAAGASPIELRREVNLVGWMGARPPRTDTAGHTTPLQDVVSGPRIWHSHPALGSQARAIGTKRRMPTRRMSEGRRCGGMLEASGERSCSLRALA
jgi:hypothetical protein